MRELLFYHFWIQSANKSKSIRVSLSGDYFGEGLCRVTSIFCYGKLISNHITSLSPDRGEYLMKVITVAKNRISVSFNFRREKVDFA